MSGPYKALYRFEYGDPDAPHALELRVYEDETGYTVTRIPPNRAGVAVAWFALLDDARAYLGSEISLAFRNDRAADEIDRLDGRSE